MTTSLQMSKPAEHSCDLPGRRIQHRTVMPDQELHCCCECLQWWWLTWRPSKFAVHDWMPVDKRVSRRKAVRLMRRWSA